MTDTKHTIRVQHDEHGMHEAVIAVRDLGDDYLLSVVLPLSDELLTSQEPDCFAALQAIRRKSEGRGWHFNCLGARRNVWPSSMSRQMGGGTRAYVLSLGQHATELVGIFDPDESPDRSTVAEQEAFAKSWFESLR